MKAFLKKYQTWLYPGAYLLIFAGILLAWFGLHRPVNIIYNGEEKIVRTASFSVPGILHSAGFAPEEKDRVITDPDQSFWELDTILVETARTILIKTPKKAFEIQTTEDIPANILKITGIKVFPFDQVLINGDDVNPNKPIEGDGPHLLQYAPAEDVSLIIDGKERVIFTSAVTLGAALEEASVQLSPEDWVSHPLSKPVDEIDEVTIRIAKTINVTVDGKIVTGFSSAMTVGEALEDIGLPLQNLDYSIPSATESLPQNGQIQVVRVNEGLMLVTDEVPFENEWIEDPDTLLDTISVIQSGQRGIFATRERIRYENGEEIWRSPEDSWQASQARDGVLGYGTQVELRKEVVDGEEIEYWRKITVYATSYSPCRSGVDGCSTGTATGIMPVQKGVIAVTPGWLSVPNGYGMWGQNVYVQGYGYGVIADVGGGIPGTPWIDLAYSDEGYVPWSRWTTMYFLPPVPAWYPPFILP